MNRNAFKKHIERLEIDDLKEELLTLFIKVKGVKEFYLMELGDDKQRKKIYDKAKKDITSKYATKSFRRPRRPRIQKVKNIIKNLETDSVLPYELIDVYLHNTEEALNFMMKYRFDSTPLRNSINSTFIKALKLIELELMKDEYKERCGSIVNNMSYAPWVFEDGLVLYKRIYM